MQGVVQKEYRVGKCKRTEENPALAATLRPASSTLASANRREHDKRIASME